MIHNSFNTKNLLCYFHLINIMTKKSDYKSEQERILQIKNNLIKYNLFEGRIADHIEHIFKIIINIGKIRGRSTQLSIILVIFLLLRKSTQKELQKLTGYSRSSVSASMNYICKLGVVNKAPIKGTHTFEYRLKGNEFEMFLGNLLVILDSVITVKNALEIKKIIKTNRNQNNKLMNDFIEFLDKYQILLENMRNNTISMIRKPINLIKNNEDKLIIDKHADNPNEIIATFFNSRLFYDQKKSLSKILCHFLENKKLTQKELCSLTKYSAGTISQGLKFLVNNSLIKEGNTRRGAQKEYFVISISDYFIQRNIIIIKAMLGQKLIYEKIKEELDTNTGELSHLKGYNELYIYLIQNLRVMPLYKKTLEDYIKIKNEMSK